MMMPRVLWGLFLLLFLSSCFKEDRVAPEIILSGDKNYMLEFGKPYNDPGYTAIDDRDGDISYLVKVEGIIDSSNAGIFHLKYNVVDASGNPAIEQVRTVYVTHYNGSLSGIYNASGQCQITQVDNSSHFVVIEPGTTNPKTIIIKALNNFTKEEGLIAQLVNNTGQDIIIPSQVIRDTTYAGHGKINANGSEIEISIFVTADSYSESCQTLLIRPTPR
jgi:hypothetical protein